MAALWRVFPLLLLFVFTNCDGSVSPSSTTEGQDTEVAGNPDAGATSDTVESDIAAQNPDTQVDTSPRSFDFPDKPTPGPTCPTQSEVNPIEEFEEATINNTRVRWVGEDTGTGVLFLFHGTAGDVTTWFDRVAGPVIIEDALKRGLVVVVIESLDRSDGAQWIVNGPPSQNADIANVKDIMAQLEENGAYGADSPRFAVGGSNGGAFTSHIAQEVTFSGAVLFISRGAAFLHEQATVPPIVVFIPGLKDTQVPASDIPASLEAVEGHGGVAHQWNNQPTPLTPDVLSRLPGISCPQSYTLTKSLQESGVLDSNWMIQEEPTLSLLAPLGAMFEDSKRVILDQLLESYGGHMVTSEYNAQWLDLFLND